MGSYHQAFTLQRQYWDCRLVGTDFPLGSRRGGIFRSQTSLTLSQTEMSSVGVRHTNLKREEIKKLPHLVLDLKNKFL